MSRDFRREAAELDAAHARGGVDDAGWAAGMAAVFASAYGAADGPRAGSGFGGDEARWEAARRPILEAVDRPGSFLDVGCANGHLLECLVRWSRHALDPYGLDLAPELVELARRLLSEVVAPGGRLIVCGYGSPRSGVAADPVRLRLRALGFEPSFELAVEAPEGGGPLLELAALDA